MKNKFLMLFMFGITISMAHSHAGDVDVKLTTSNGATKFTVQNAAAAEVASIASDGSANFNVLYTTSARVGGLLDRNATNVAVSNTIAETSVYSYVIPGGLLGTNRGVKVRLRGTYLNNSGAARSIRLRFKYGGVTILDKTSATNAASATSADFYGEFMLSNTGATNTQEAVGQLLIDRAGILISPIIDTGTAAVDSTANQTLNITITHSNATATITFTKEGATLFLD
jgi:hypothetical protein